MSVLKMPHYQYLRVCFFNDILKKKVNFKINFKITPLGPYHMYYSCTRQIKIIDNNIIY